MSGVVEFMSNLPLDQVAALVGQSASLIAALFLYHYMPTTKVSPSYRHLFVATLGSLLTTLVYGWEGMNLLILVIVSYLLMIYLPAGRRGWVTCMYSVFHVLSFHLYNYKFFYMQFRMDASNSLMIFAMKSSYTAFSIDDNFKPLSHLTPRQLRYRLRSIPSFYEYFCYQFCFLGVLFGPAYHYREYQSFIEGDQYKSKWPLRQAVMVMLSALISIVMYFIFCDSFNVRTNILRENLSEGFLYRHILLWFTMFITRCKYYFAWMSSESICYFAGLGYQYDNNEWNSHITTVDIPNVELSPNMKIFADSWNIFTGRFLQFCIFERVTTYKQIKVFVVSATWHGFYPGYYIMFLALGLATYLGKKLRRHVRPYFQSSYSSQRFYNVLTCTATSIAIAYNSAAFELKDLDSIWKLHSSLYFWPHVVILVGILIVPNGSHSTDSSELQTNGYRDIINGLTSNGKPKTH